MPAVHELKTWPRYFNALLDGSKTFEVRFNDRDYKVGDTLHLREFVPPSGAPDDGGDYTGREMRRVVSYIADEGFSVVGWVIMGLASPAAPGIDK